MHMRDSDKIRIAVNEAFCVHLANRKGLYINGSTAGVSLSILCCTTVTSLISGRVKIRNRNASRDLHCIVVKSGCFLKETSKSLAGTHPWVGQVLLQTENFLGM